MLVKHCFACHGPSKQKGGLRLDRKSAALKGGDSGPCHRAAAKRREPDRATGLEGEEEDRVMPPKGGGSAPGRS